MLTDQTISAFGRAIDSPESPLKTEFARTILQWRLRDQDNRRLDALIVKSRSVGLTSEESASFDELCVTADLLSLLHLHAREALGEFRANGV